MQRLHQAVAHLKETPGALYAEAGSALDVGAHAPPFGAHCRRHITHLVPSHHFIGRRRALQQMPGQTLGRHVPHARLARQARDLRDLAVVDSTDDVQPEQPARPGGAPSRQPLDIIVEMIDGRLACLQRPGQSDLLRHVTRKRNAHLAGGLDNRIIARAIEAGVDLEHVVAGSLLLADHPAAVLRRSNAVTVERGTGSMDPGCDDLATFGAGAQREVMRRSEHAAGKGDAIRDVEEQHILGPLDVGRVGRDMGVHLCQSRHEIAVASVDPG
jgi:hypothetical protein